MDEDTLENGLSLEEIVELFAPTDLNEGYELTAEVEGETCTVRIPEGGVRRGELFKGTVISKAIASKNDHRYGDESTTSSKNPHDIPTGRWRDGCFDPICFWSFCCWPIALGQVMTRMKLNIFATPSRTSDLHTCRNLTMIVAIYSIVTFIMTIFWFSTAAASNEPPSVFFSFMKTIINLGYSIFMLVILIKTRMHIRAVYGITQSCPLEDCCCSCCCAPWIVWQMARHTADYRKFHATCCTETGLSPTAPSPLLTDNDNLRRANAGIV